jgi:transposase InsO family protein
VGQLRPTLSPHPWHTVYVDAQGPLPASDVGRETLRYVMGGIDAFSRMVFLRAYSSIPADTTIDFLEQLLARTVTRPRVIRCDGGKQFDNNKARAWCTARGIKLVIGVPAHHRGQGLIERVFGTLVRALTINSFPDPSSWAHGRRLEALEALINATRHGVLGMSPFAVMHGFEPRMEVDARLDLPGPVYACLDEYHARLAAAQEVALLHSAVAQVDNKAEHDKQHRAAEVFETGDYVLVLDEHATKLVPPASGPYRVVERLAGGDTYRLARLLTESETRVVHALRMVRFNMARTSEEREAMRRFGGGVDVIKEIVGHTLRKDGGYDFTVTWGDGDTTQQCGHSIQRTAAFKEYIADKGIKKGPAIKKPS